MPAREPDEFTKAYVEAALWISTDESRADGGDSMDRNYTAADIAPATMDRITGIFPDRAFAHGGQDG